MWPARDVDSGKFAQLFPRARVAYRASVLPAFGGLISQIDRSLGHGAASVKATLRKSPEWTPVKIAHSEGFILASFATRSISCSAILIAAARLSGVTPDLFLPPPNRTFHRKPVPSTICTTVYSTPLCSITLLRRYNVCAALWLH